MSRLTSKTLARFYCVIFGGCLSWIGLCLPFLANTKLRILSGALLSLKRPRCCLTRDGRLSTSPWEPRGCTRSSSGRNTYPSLSASHIDLVSPTAVLKFRQRMNLPMHCTKASHSLHLGLKLGDLTLYCLPFPQVVSGGHAPRLPRVYPQAIVTLTSPTSELPLVIVRRREYGDVWYGAVMRETALWDHAGRYSQILPSWISKVSRRNRTSWSGSYSSLCSLAWWMRADAAARPWTSCISITARSDRRRNW
ncbi:hypothetical protein BV25DRAFT_829520 [Artomyces pyxidatus]|uniref:Uncharacterized protein n=1 Tax=Artomyces pyxidatus TaxID=48021 RepID=A0ACB8SX27_9AGAM|nr:hypothetical protein BV25DRAFT_829520 [Artomyces pyxidatus]